MKHISEKLELVANTAIIVVTILLSAVLVKSYLFTNNDPNLTQASSPTMARKGQPVNVTDVNWRQNGKTLLLALSTTCHFCSESAPFYQRLAKESDVRLIVAIPQNVSDGKAYLDGLGVPISDVRQASPRSLGVAGTPTLLMVDDEGHVSGEWVGKLKPEQEDEVLKQVRPGAGSH